VQLDADPRERGALMKHHQDPRKVAPENVWQYWQNACRLVLRDCRDLFGLNDAQVADLARVLIARGIAKWLRARKTIIRTKDRWKREITTAQEQLRGMSEGPQKQRLRGELAALIRCREDVRAICHSERWTLGADEADEIAMSSTMAAGSVVR